MLMLDLVRGQMQRGLPLVVGVDPTHKQSAATKKRDNAATISIEVCLKDLGSYQKTLDCLFLLNDDTCKKCAKTIEGNPWNKPHHPGCHKSKYYKEYVDLGGKPRGQVTTASFTRNVNQMNNFIGNMATAMARHGIPICQEHTTIGKDVGAHSLPGQEEAILACADMDSVAEPPVAPRKLSFKYAPSDMNVPTIINDALSDIEACK